MRMRCAIVAILAFAASSADAPAQDQAAVATGEQLYEENCAPCHGEKLRGTGTAFDLRTLKANDRSRFDRFVMDGKGQMPPWRGTLSEQDLDQLWAYIRAHAN